jgi:hypothetical protein
LQFESLFNFEQQKDILKTLQIFTFFIPIPLV